MFLQKHTKQETFAAAVCYNTSHDRSIERRSCVAVNTCGSVASRVTLGIPKGFTPFRIDTVESQEMEEMKLLLCTFRKGMKIKEIMNAPPAAKPMISYILGCLVDGFWGSSSPDLG